MDETGKNKKPPLPPIPPDRGNQIKGSDLEISNPLSNDFAPDVSGAVAAPLPRGMYEDDKLGWRDKIGELFFDRRKMLIAGIIFILLMGGFIAFLLIRRGGPPASETPADNNGRLPIAGQTTPDLNPIVYRPGDGTLVVFWTTDRPTDGRVNYGLSPNYTYFADDQETLHPSRYSTRHNVILRGLDSTQTYHLMASSLDRDGNILFSNDITVRPVKDTVSPKVAFKTPRENSKLAGRAQVCPQVSDDQGIYSVTFLVDNRPLVVRRGNFNDCFEFDTSQFGNSNHTLGLFVSDGVNTSSATINVNIDNFPEGNQSGTIDKDYYGCTNISNSMAVILIHPQNGATLSGIANLTAQVTATGGKQISHVIFTVDLDPVRTVGTAPYNSTFNTAFYPDGQHIIKAIAVADDGTCSDYLSNNGPHAATVTFDNFGPGSGGIFITNVQVVPTTNTLAVSWTTNQNTNSVVNYGLDQNYGQQVSDNQYVSNHSLTISGLQSNTLYYLRLSGATQNGTNATPYQTFAQTLNVTTGGSEDCANGVDDDSDGLVDDADSDCSSNVGGPTGCVNINSAISVTITNPVNEAVIAGDVDITADVRVASGITINRVVFLINDREFADDNTMPYSAVLSTTNYSNGVYVIKAVAQGANGECSDTDDDGPHVVLVSIRNLPLTVESIFATPTDIYANVHFKTTEPVTAEVVYGRDRTQLNDPQRSFRVAAWLQPVAPTGPSSVQVSSSDPVNLSANPLRITAGETVTLRWQANIATDNCSASWRSSNPGIAGTQEFHPTVTTTYTYSCIEFNSGQRYTTNITVEVLQPYAALVATLLPQQTLMPRTTYYYKIIARSMANPNKIVESEINEFTTLLEPTRNDMTASVTWIPSCAGTKGIVQYSRLPLDHPSANPTTLTASFAGGTYTAVIAGLHNAVTYYYRVITQGGHCPAGGSIDQSGTFETPGG